MSRFLERLASETPIVADGGMGAVLSSVVPDLRCPEEANLRAPESVLEVHLGYIRAGAELIETNSFGANRAKLGRQFLAEELEQINAAAKSALQGGLLLSLKNEIVRIAPNGRVNAVAPGWTYSPMTRGELDPELVARLTRTMALRKVAVAEDVARAVVVLASDELSGHVTGELVTVAGGMEGRTVHELA